MMRIIAGDKRGHGLVAPEGDLTRPTLGRVRESVFSILSDDIVDAQVIDLFAGAGTLGLEALSRGAEHCTFVENNVAAVQALRTNLEKLKLEASARVAQQDVFAWLRSADLASRSLLILADPPYHKDLASKLLQTVENLTIHPDSMLVLQVGKRDRIEANPHRWNALRVERYGETTVHFLLPIPQPT